MTAPLHIYVHGNARARGQAHGEALREQIHAHAAAWFEALASAGFGDPYAYVKTMLRETDFEASLRVHAPDLLEEVQGIAAGAALDPEIAFALQLIDEEWAFRARREANAVPHQKCSSFAIVGREGAPTWIGQNMDLGAYTDGHQALLAIGPHLEQPAALLLSLAGAIGLLGVNAAGVAVCVNSLPQLPSAPRGVPVAFVIRKLLQKRSAREAAETCTVLPHATYQHYLIADVSEVFSLEASAAGVVRYEPPEDGRVLHTNHPLGSERGVRGAERSEINSAARLASLVNRLGAGTPTLETLQAALSAFDDPEHPVCRLRSSEPGLINFTTGSMISALRSDGSVESWISTGPPSLGGYRHVPLRGAPGSIF